MSTVMKEERRDEHIDEELRQARNDLVKTQWELYNLRGDHDRLGKKMRRFRLISVVLLAFYSVGAVINFVDWLFFT